MKVQELLREAQLAQRPLHEKLAGLAVEGRAEGGLLRVRLNGLEELGRGRFAAGVTNQAGSQLFAEALMVAWQEAREVGAKAGQLLAGLGLPGGLV